MNKEIEQHLESLAEDYAEEHSQGYGIAKEHLRGALVAPEVYKRRIAYKAGAKAAYEIGVLQGRIEVLEEIGNTTLVKILKMELSEMLGRGK